MVELKQNPTLADVQSYVYEMKHERGFWSEDKINECFLLGEEVGELFKAVRKNQKGSNIDPNSAVFNVGEELADILIYLCAIATQHSIDLETAFRAKEEINKKRIWNKTA